MMPLSLIQVGALNNGRNLVLYMFGLSSSWNKKAICHERKEKISRGGLNLRAFGIGLVNIKIVS